MRWWPPCAIFRRAAAAALPFLQICHFAAAALPSGKAGPLSLRGPPAALLPLLHIPRQAVRTQHQVAPPPRAVYLSPREPNQPHPARLHPQQAEIVPPCMHAAWASPERQCQPTLPLAVIDCHCLEIYKVISLPLLSFSAKMTVSPRANACGPGAPALHERLVGAVVAGVPARRGHEPGPQRLLLPDEDAVAHLGSGRIAAS